MRSKLFNDMTFDEQMEHLEKCRLNAIECIRNGEDACLADIADWPDIWGPWLTNELKAKCAEVEKLKEEIKILKAELSLWEPDSRFND